MASQTLPHVFLCMRTDHVSFLVFLSWLSCSQDLGDSRRRQAKTLADHAGRLTPLSRGEGACLQIMRITFPTIGWLKI